MVGIGRTAPSPLCSWDRLQLQQILCRIIRRKGTQSRSKKKDTVVLASAQGWRCEGVSSYSEKTSKLPKMKPAETQDADFICGCQQVPSWRPAPTSQTDRQTEVMTTNLLSSSRWFSGLVIFQLEWLNCSLLNSAAVVFEGTKETEVIDGAIELHVAAHETSMTRKSRILIQAPLLAWAHRLQTEPGRLLWRGVSYWYVWVYDSMKDIY